MNLSGKCNELSLRVGNITSLLKSYYVEVLNEATEQLLELMRKEVFQTVWGDGPGKPEWREEISRKLKLLYSEITDQYLEFGAGLPDGQPIETFVKAMVIAEGAGTAVGNSPITAGPPGREVWDDDLDEKHPSTAKTEYLLPAEFNQMGNHFVDNAVLLMRKHFRDILESASRNLPSSLFYQNVYVTPR